MSTTACGRPCWLCVATRGSTKGNCGEIGSWSRFGPGTDAAGAHWRHIGIYAYRRDYLLKLVSEPPCRLENLEKLEQLRALYIGCRMNVLQVKDVGIGVDTPEDIVKVEAILASKNIKL